VNYIAAQEEEFMELSLRLDTLGIVEIHYLRTRERYRDWPAFLLLAASRQARVLAYLSREVAEQLHQQILAVEEAAGLGIDDEDEDKEEDEEINGEELNGEVSTKSAERETSSFSPAFAQTLERLNELARQRLPADASSSATSINSELTAETDMPTSEEEAALEQLQEAFVQMMEVVRELAEELSTDALKVTSRFRCGRTTIGFTQAEATDDEDEDDTEEDSENAGTGLELEVELALILQLYEEGHSRTDDLPAVELQLDVDDFEHLHESLDIALARDDRRARRRR
jgi:hypothetical protein